MIPIYFCSLSHLLPLSCHFSISSYSREFSIHAKSSHARKFIWKTLPFHTPTPSPGSFPSRSVSLPPLPSKGNLYGPLPPPPPPILLFPLLGTLNNLCQDLTCVYPLPTLTVNSMRAETASALALLSSPRALPSAQQNRR